MGKQKHRQSRTALNLDGVSDAEGEQLDELEAAAIEAEAQQTPTERQADRRARIMSGARQRYICIHNLIADRVSYNPGELVELTDGQAEKPKQLGAIELYDRKKHSKILKRKG